jgi:hypothetical protein
MNAHVVKMQQTLQFPLMDELLGTYLQVERLIMKNALAAGIRTD